MFNHNKRRQSATLCLAIGLPSPANLFIYIYYHLASISSNHAPHPHYKIMTSSSGNIFRVTGPLCGEFTGPPNKGQWSGGLVFSLICAWINGWLNNHEAGDLRRHRAHYDVIIMVLHFPSLNDKPVTVAVDFFRVHGKCLTKYTLCDIHIQTTCFLLLGMTWIHKLFEK